MTACTNHMKQNSKALKATNITNYEKSITYQAITAAIMNKGGT